MKFVLLVLLTLGLFSDPHDLQLKRAVIEPSHATGGLYRVGDKVQIVADLASPGERFTGWTSDPVVELSDSSSAHTSFTMPDGHLTIIALYAPKDSR